MTRPVPFLLALAFASACGPIQSTSYLLDADVQLEAARTAGAPERAPYEWTAANLYLHKAREEVGYSKYEVALEYAQKARRFALEARERATATQPLDTTPGVTPLPPETTPSEDASQAPGATPSVQSFDAPPRPPARDRSGNGRTAPTGSTP